MARCCRTWLGDDELLDDWMPYQGRVAYSFTPVRLGGIYLRLGRNDDAKQHCATFLETSTNPDPEYESMVTEARPKLAGLARGR